MKKWMKWALGVTLTLFLLVTVLYFIRQKQIRDYKLDFIAAQHETKPSILEYSKTNSVPGEIRVAKDTVGYQEISDLFAPGSIIVLDSNDKIVDCNFNNYNGSCYFDIAENICDNFNFKRSKYNHQLADSTVVNLLEKSTIDLTDEVRDEIKKYDYTVIYCWAKWMKSSYTNEGSVQKIGQCIKENKKLNVRLVSVNSDCVAPWYPMTTELPITQK